MTRELGVDRLVGAVRLPLEEVGDAPPPVRDENALVDDVDAAADRLPGLASGPLPVVVGLELDRHHLATLGTQPLEVGLLVLAPLAEDELSLLVLGLGLLELAARDLQRERGQVLARQVVRDVGRRERDAAVVELHISIVVRAAPVPYPRAQRPAPTNVTPIANCRRASRRRLSGDVGDDGSG